MIHSYTALAEWRLCPRAHKARFIDKSVKTEETPALKEGKRVHELLQHHLENGLPVPEGLKLDARLWTILQRYGARAEVKVAMTRDGRGCNFFDNDNAWIRGALDVYKYVEGKQVALAADWKTGKPGYTDELQAEVYAAILYAIVHVQRTLFIFSYVKHGVNKPITVDGAKALANVRRLAERVEADTEHPPRPGWKCKWCPVKWCEYNDSE